jgi:hypothetical protein
MVKSVRRSGRLLPAGLSAVVLVLVAACGTQHATSSSPVSGPSSPLSEPTAKPSVNHCPQVPGVVAQTPCVSVGAEQNQQANQTFNSRIPLSAAVAAEAAPLTRRIQESLEKLTSVQRTDGSDVRSALLAGGMQSTDLVVLGGPSTANVAFGGYEQLDTRQAVCAWGTVSVKAVEVDSAGITREGGCLPTAGGH